MVVTRGKGFLGSNAWSGPSPWWRKLIRLWVVETQCSVQIMYQKYTLETYMMLLTSVTPINVIKINKQKWSEKRRKQRAREKESRKSAGGGGTSEQTPARAGGRWRVSGGGHSQRTPGQLKWAGGVRESLGWKGLKWDGSSILHFIWAHVSCYFSPFLF